MEDKILNNRFDAVEYGTDNLRNNPIAINPAVSDMYEESITEDIEGLRQRKTLEEEMYQLYIESEFYKKYKKECKRIERPDIPLVYAYFKKKLKEKGTYNMVEIFCAIAEFFELNYKVLFNDIISLDDKGIIMSVLDANNGLDSEYDNCEQLF